MLVKDVWHLAIEKAKSDDLRGKQAVEKVLKRQQKIYDDLSEKEQENFNVELLDNPYPDSVILYDNGNEVNKIMVGIDIDISELLLAKELNVDLVISHHPQAQGLLNLNSVMELQVGLLAKYGVPINIAQNLLKPRISEVGRSINSKNAYRVVDAAKLLDINFMCLHTVCDNLVARYLYDEIEKSDLEYVSDVLDLLNNIPEYKQAKKMSFGPVLFAGNKNNYAGKIALTEITGGTEGVPAIYKHLAQAGIGTVIGMHMSDKHRKAAKDAHVNALIAGHMSSDSLGVNLLLDELLNKDKNLEILPVSGLIRVKR